MGYLINLPISCRKEMIPTSPLYDQTSGRGKNRIWHCTARGSRLKPLLGNCKSGPAVAARGSDTACALPQIHPQSCWRPDRVRTIFYVHGISLLVGTSTHHQYWAAHVWINIETNPKDTFANWAMFTRVDSFKGSIATQWRKSRCSWTGSAVPV